jgi:hypothetical protein
VVVVWFSQTQIEMDSSAIYVNSSSKLVAEGDLRSHHLASYERVMFATDLEDNLTEWTWRDFATGDTLAPAFDEPPGLPELSRWMPTTDSNITWDDIQQIRSRDVMPMHVLHRAAGAPDSVLVYQYA